MSLMMLPVADDLDCQLDIADADGESFAYAVAPLPPGLDVWAVALENLETEESYSVALDPAGAWRCTCPDWRYRHHEREGGCKHVAALRCLYALIARFNTLTENHP